MSQEPIITPSILATIPDLLKRILIETMKGIGFQRNKNILVSSNSLANRFIFERWGIRSSQRRHYRDLFFEIREQCRNIFRHYEKKERILCQENTRVIKFGVFKFDEIRGNLILGFVMQSDIHPFR